MTSVIPQDKFFAIWLVPPIASALVVLLWIALSLEAKLLVNAAVLLNEEVGMPHGDVQQRMYGTMSEPKTS